MPRAATKSPTRYSSERISTRPSAAPGQITPAQVWQQLSATQQQALQRTITSVCRSLAGQVAKEEVHDDQS
jgi:hypothetical protein